MAKQNSDPSTTDLLNDGTPSKVAVTVEAPYRLRAIRFSQQITRAFSEILRESHTVSPKQAFALLHATRDARIFGMELSRFYYAVIPERYLGAVENALIEDQKEQLKRAQLAARKEWKGVAR